MFSMHNPLRSYIIRGETKNNSFKVDLRVCLHFNDTDYDLSNIEFKKTGNDLASIKEDEAKVLVEGKTILNSLSDMYNVDLNGSKKLKVIVGQFCGIKGLFQTVRFIAPGAYLGQQWGKTMKFPVCEKMVDGFVDGSMEQLFMWRESCLKEAQNMKNSIMKDDSQFGSQSTVDEQTFVKKTYYLSRKARTAPKPIEDIFVPEL